MKRALLEMVNRQLAHRGLMIGKLTPREEVDRFIRRLRPLEIDLIRVGAEGDGGYLLPDDLEGIRACFSPGVDRVSEFELACLERGMHIVMADRSVDRPSLDIAPERYDFLKKYVGCTDNEDFITLDSWVDSRLPDSEGDLLLQMDIEGAEYETLINVSDRLVRRFRIIVIEFHGFDKLWVPSFFSRARSAVEKLLQTHACVHVHPNNCCGSVERLGIEVPRLAELTFLRNDRVGGSSAYRRSLPHPLDRDNTANPPLRLSPRWFGEGY